MREGYAPHWQMSTGCRIIELLNSMSINHRTNWQVWRYLHVTYEAVGCEHRRHDTKDSTCQPSRRRLSLHTSTFARGMQMWSFVHIYMDDEAANWVIWFNWESHLLSTTTTKYLLPNLWDHDSVSTESETKINHYDAHNTVTPATNYHWVNRPIKTEFAIK